MATACFEILVLLADFPEFLVMPEALTSLLDEFCLLSAPCVYSLRPILDRISLWDL